MSRLVGVDIGGTNTDLIFVDAAAGRLITAKVPTTAGDQAVGLIQGIEALGIGAPEIDLLIHGTTVATNAAIERKGARCGLITTAGFRDVLELRRRDRPHTYGLTGDFRPLIERRHRREVTERVSAEGEILTPLDESELETEIGALAADGCEVLVIAFLHSYANPAHERRAAEIARQIWPNDYIVASYDILPAMREFERTSTAAVSGYVQPLIGRYLDSLGAKLAAAGYLRDLLVVQSNGGVMAAPIATRYAANTILSGPAAGVTAAAVIATELGLSDIVSCDMGGTSLDVCVIRDGRPGLTSGKILDFGIPLALPMLDVDAIGAGGGSMARIDRAGILQVGPESAGSNPGPVCYGRGGSVPTVTDACLVLGHLDPEAAIGKTRGAAMDRSLARDCIAETIGNPLGLTADEAAEAILTVTGAKMAGHIRRKLLERGLDPRTFSIVAFGGAGPLHANRILREVDLKSAVIPYYPGITSAMGCVLGSVRHDFMRTVNLRAGAGSVADLASVFAEQRRQGADILAAEGVDFETATVLRGADMCYRGQSNMFPVTMPTGELEWSDIVSTFERAYQERYGRLLDRDAIVVVNARTAMSGAAELASLASFISLPDGPPPPATMSRIRIGGRFVDAAVHQRLTLPAGERIAGPAILLQPDTTTVIEPGYFGTVHPTGNIVIEGAR